MFERAGRHIGELAERRVNQDSEQNDIGLQELPRVHGHVADAVDPRWATFSLGIMWLTLIVAETISASAGIGYMTMNAREFLQTDVVLLGVLIYAALGKLADVATRALEHRALSWHPSYQPLQKV